MFLWAVSRVRPLPLLQRRLAWAHRVEVQSTPESTSPVRWETAAAALPVQARWTRVSINRERPGTRALRPAPPIPMAEPIGQAESECSSAGQPGRRRARLEFLQLVGGGNGVALKNSKGVVLKVKGKEVGLELAPDLSGMEIRLKR